MIPYGRVEGALTASVLDQEEGDAAVFDLDGRVGLGRGFSAALNVPLVYVKREDGAVGLGALSAAGRHAREARLGPGVGTLGGGLGLSIPADAGEDLPPGERGFITGSIDPTIEALAAYDFAAGPGAFAGVFWRPVLYRGGNDLREGDQVLTSGGPRIALLDGRVSLQAALAWLHRTERSGAPAADWLFASPRVALWLGRYAVSVGARLPLDQPEAAGEPRANWAVSVSLGAGWQAFGAAER